MEMAGTSRDISSVMTSAANNYHTRLDSSVQKNGYFNSLINFDTCSTLSVKVSAEPTKISKRTQKKTNDKDRAFAKWFKAPKHMPLRETIA